MIEKTEAARLAAAVNQLRPEWPAQSILTLIGSKLRDRAYRDVAVAFAWIAADPTTLTPGRILENGPWWQAASAQSPTVSAVTHRCPTHPAERAWDCQPCIDDAADPDAGLAAVKAALRDAPKPPTPRAPRPAASDLHDARTRLQEETP